MGTRTVRPFLTFDDSVSAGCTHLWANCSQARSVTVAAFPGDGIGPEIFSAVEEVFSAAGAPINWQKFEISDTVDPRTNSFITREALDAVLVRCAKLRMTASMNHLLAGCGVWARVTEARLIRL